ncbi:MAG: OmpA family protein [Pseudomonadales bacterium]
MPFRLRHPVTNVTYFLLDGLTLNSGDNLIDQNLPVDPSGIVYDTDSRTPLDGATIAVQYGNGDPLPDVCLLPGQQNQVTDVDGAYKVDVRIGADAACPSGVTLTLAVTAPADYVDGPSATLPPLAGPFDPTGLANPLLVQPQPDAPQEGDDTSYYLQFVLENGDPDVIHNHIPLDPVGEFDLRLTKRAGKRMVSVGDLVPYVIEVRNVGGRLLTNVTLTDLLPPGFRLVTGSVRAQPEVADLTVTGERPLVIGGLRLSRNQIIRVSYLLRVGAGVTQGEYRNLVSATFGAAPIGNTASAEVEVVADPDFEQTTIIGKVFDDRNGNGWQDKGEPGVPGVRLATVTGLLVETDEHGRYHLAGIDVSRFERGQNFYLKLDTTTLPEGSTVVSENPRVLRITQGLMNQIDFAVQLAAPVSVEAVEVGDVFFEPGGVAVRQRYVRLLDSMAERIGQYDGGDIVVLARAGDESLALTRAQTLRDLLMARLGEHAPDFNLRVQTAVTQTELVRLSEREVAVNAEVYFDTDSDVVREDYVPVLQTLARQMQAACNGELVIEGHADKRGDVSYNQALSERRTAAVRQVLEAAGAFLRERRECRTQPAKDGARAPEPVAPVARPLGQTDDKAVGGFMARLGKRALAALLTAIAPPVWADDADPCALEYCMSDEGVAVRIVSRGEEAPRQPDDSDTALQDNRRVTVTGHVNMPGAQAPAANADRASVRGRVYRQLGEGITLWTTEDPLGASPMLGVATPAGVTTMSTGLREALSFPFYTNYAAFLTKLELRIYRAADADRVSPVAVLEATPRHLGEFLWAGPSARTDQEFVAVVRAWDAKGNFDETRPQTFVLEDLDTVEPAERERLLPSGVDRWRTVYGRSDLALQNIPLAASRVRLHGSVQGAEPRILVDGSRLPLADANRFAVEYLLPVGEHEMAVVVEREGEDPQKEKLDVHVSGKYMFVAALADITASDNNISGNVEALSGDDRYDGNFLVDGRLAFYLKGKIRGRYLVTAQLDTREDEIGDMFSNIQRKDADALFRRLDPDRYYPVYGDDSTTVADVQTMGRMYVRVDWDKSQFLWGNYDTGVTGTEFAQYNRSLYGARGEYNSTRTTELGEAKTHAKLFVSETETAFGHAEFLGTGGSLYYLPHTDILQGSEKVTLEIRDRDSNRVLESVEMLRGQDYDVDEIQGRIILNRPLLQVRGRQNSVVRNNPLDGDTAILLIDYEYLPDNFGADNLTLGGRAKQWFGEHVAVGGTAVNEGRGGEDYRLYGLDLTLQQGRGTYLKMEAAGTQASQSAGFYSDNGGLSFAQRGNSAAVDRDGMAYALEGRVNFQELGWTPFDLALGTWWRDSEDDFSVARRDVGVGLTEWGLELSGRFAEDLGYTLKTTSVERGSATDDVTSGLLDWQMTDTNRLRMEIQRHANDDSFTGADRDETVAAVEFAHTFNARFELYGGLQGTLSESGATSEGNDMLFLGSRSRLTERLRLDTELTTGDRGDGATVGIDWARNDRHSVYGSLTHSTDTTMLPGGGEQVTFGNRFRVSNQTSLFAENQFVTSDAASGFTHAYGVDYAPAPGWSLGLSVQKGDLDAVAGIVDRTAGTVSAGFRNDRFQWRSVVEYRKDDGAEQRDQILTTNNLDFRWNESLRLLAKLNLSKTDDDLAGVSGGEFAEAGFGAAYRPVENDRLNVLAKYTYLYDLASLGQFGAGLDQRSHIGTVEAIYRFLPRWKVGAKLGMRKGELRAERDQGDWYRSTVNFAALRLRYNIMGKWDALAEYRRLEVEEDNSVRDGILVGVDRQIGDYMQVGAGYNFADFSDDLRILDYEQKGWFVNLVGKF